MRVLRSSSDVLYMFEMAEVDWGIMHVVSKHMRSGL